MAHKFHAFTLLDNNENESKIRFVVGVVITKKQFMHLYDQKKQRKEKFVFYT